MNILKIATWNISCGIPSEWNISNGINIVTLKIM